MIIFIEIIVNIIYIQHSKNCVMKKFENFIVLQEFYRIKWHGYPNSDNTWEPRDNLDKCGEMLEQFQTAQAHEVLSEYSMCCWNN